MTEHLLLKIKRPPSMVGEHYDGDHRERRIGDVYGTGCWQLRMSINKYRQDRDARLFGVQLRWGSYRQWLRDEGWRSLTINIGWPRRIRRIGLTWSDSRFR